MFNLIRTVKNMLVGVKENEKLFTDFILLKESDEIHRNELLYQ